MNQLQSAAIIPTFNRASAVLEALDSVAAQTLQPQCVIVVDDGSTDDTAARVQAWIDAHRDRMDVRLIQQANAGPSAARNRGAAEATACDLLAYLDSDDLWPADYLQRMVAAFEQNPGATAVVSHRLFIDVVTSEKELRRYDSPGRLTTASMFVEGPPGSSNVVIRRAAFEQVGGYDPAHRCAEDYQLMLRLSLLGPLMLVPGEPVTCRRNMTGDGAPAHASKALNDRRYVLAQVLDRFAHEDGGTAVMPAEQWRKRLGSTWYHAGRALKKLNRNAEARASFRRCVTTLPCHWRARLQLLTLAKKD